MIEKPGEVHLMLGSYRRRKRAQECALVLRAKGFGVEIQHTPAGFALWVRSEDLDAALQELRLYRAENVDWPPSESAPVPGVFWARATILYLALLVLVFAFDNGHAFGFDWRLFGRVDGAAMGTGQWTRALSALTLHADLVHLLSNMTYGALFGGLVAYALGGGLGWLAVLAAGTLGNALNAWILEPQHLSIGASTAIFGAVGILAGSEVVRRHLLRQRRLRRAAPVLVAFLLLGYLGMGGSENRDLTTDVSAHLFGLLVGFAIGFPLGFLPARCAQNRRLQGALGYAALLAVVLAWVLRLS